MTNTKNTDTAVTLAVLVTRFDSLEKNLSDKMDEIRDDIKAINGTVRDDSERVTRLEERLGPWTRTQTVISATFTLVGSAIAAWWGSQK